MAMNLDALLRIKANVLGEEAIRRLGNSLQGLQGQAKNAALGFNNLKGAVAGFGAAIAGSAIVAGLGAIVKKSIDAGDELFNLQAKTGVAASALIGIGNAAKLADVDVGTLGKGITKLNINRVKAAEGNEDLARKFQALGVNVKGANGQVVPADKALKQIADRFADMPDGAQKAAAAVALFGKAGADLIPLLNEGAASMEKFTYKVGEDFAARSDKFNDTITELGIKTQGFGLELTDALLPALQSILEVFADLFDTDQDWTALFAVIKVGLRAVATVIYAMIKLVDQLIKTVVYSVDAIGKALKGDFEGAGRAISQGFGAGLEQAKRDFAQIQKLWTDAPSSGTGQRSGGRGMALDTSAADTAAAAAARKAASEQERADKRYNEGLQGAIDLAGDLNKQIRDINLKTQSVGASPVDKILNEFQASLNAIQDEQDNLFKKADEFTSKTGVQFEGLRNKIKALGATKVTEAAAVREQALIDLLPSLQDYADKIAEITRGTTQLTEVEKLEALIKREQLDVLLQLNPELAKEIELRRQQAAAVDAANKAKSSQSFRGKIEEYAKSMDDLGAVLGDAAVNAFGKLEDSLTEFVTTGKLQFQEFVASIISDLAKLAVKFAVVNTVKAILGFEDGGIMTRSGPAPLKKYASGGIANSPQLAMFGEGSTPEAYVPLPDGRRIPVAMQGGGGGSTTVNVSVDAKGTSVQGNSGQGEQLGRAISQAVQAELIKQRRPGGILAMA